MWQGRVLFACCAFVLTACSGGEDRFTETYTDILAIRMSQRDSIEGNRRVQEALAQHGYTEEAFRIEFLERARNPERLRTLLDSARSRALRRVSESKSQESNRQR